MGNAGTVNISLVARTAEFTANMKTAVASVVSLESTVNRVQAMVVGFLGVAALKAVTTWTHGIMESIDATAKFADRIGSTTEFLTTMAHAADLSGVANETLSVGLQKMVKNISEANNGNKQLAQTFTELHLGAENLAALDPQSQFLQLSEAMKAVNNSGDRARLAMDVFGKSGAELLPVLDMGIAGFQDMREEADRLGLSFSRMDAAKVEAANDALTRVGAVATGIGRSIAIEVSPVVTALANDFVNQANSMGGWRAIVLGALESVVKGIGYIMTAWDYAKAGFIFFEYAGANLAKSFLQAADKVVQGFQWISGVASNISTAVMDTFKWMGASIATTWALLKVPIAMFVQWIGTQLSEMLHMVSAAAMKFDAKMGASLLEAANKVSVSTGDMKEKAKIAADSAADDMRNAGQKAKDSWSNIFSVDASGSAAIQGMIDEYQTAGDETGAAFWGAWDTATEQRGMTGLLNWFARVKVESDKMAEVTASTIKNKQESDLAASAERKKAVIDDETWLTAFMGDEAKKRLDWDKKTNADKLSFASGVLGNLATLQNTHSRKAFAIGKAAAMAQAVVSTAAGIARAFGELPFWVAIPAAAAIGVAGAVQISAIAGTQFGGGGSVSSSSGSISMVGGEPIGVGQSAQPGVTGNRQNTIQVNFTGLSDNQILNGQQMRQLIEQINEAQSDGSPINVAVAA